MNKSLLKTAKEDSQFRKRLISSLTKKGSSKTLEQMMSPIRIQYLEELTSNFKLILFKNRWKVDPKFGSFLWIKAIPPFEETTNYYTISFTFTTESSKIRITADGPAGNYIKFLDAMKVTPKQMAGAIFDEIKRFHETA